MRSKSSQHVFSIIDLANANHKKYQFVIGIPRTNEAAGLIVLSPYLAQTHA
jgi:hypothetical protein